ncbi:hypothetical protein L873DRAFT_1799994, partial [Choiromyces venosus 120613-1]
MVGGEPYVPFLSPPSFFLSLTIYSILPYAVPSLKQPLYQDQEKQAIRKEGSPIHYS